MGLLWQAAAGLLVGASISAAAAQPTPTTETRLHCPAKFITAIAVGSHGGLWVGDEDTGIYYRRAGATAWDSFNTGNSPGLVSNHIYSLCVDAKGRLWAGTLRHGVCVYNGSRWQHYGIITGPLGSHVVAIANNPRDGSVWMCTEAGISIYQCESGTSKAQGKSRATVSGSHVAKSVRQPSPLTPAQIAKLPLNVQMQLSGQSQGSDANSVRGAAAYKPHTWHYITRMNGLPANPDCIAFNKAGTAFVGTLCGGLAIAHYPYTSWHAIKGPWHMPRTAYGGGLPSNLINCVAVGPGGTVYVGTDLGLAISHNNGESFRYERGRDYAAKILGLWHPPIGYRPPPQAFLNKLLPGDHITCVAPIGDGDVWLGTWRASYAMLNTRTGRIFQSRLTPELRSLDGYINAMAMAPKGKLAIGRYGGGAAALKLASVARPAVAAGRGHRPSAQADVDTGLPARAAPPTAAELAALCRQLERTRPSPHHLQPYVIPFDSDWRTQGTWLGRYGRYWACLFACCSPEDYVWGPGPQFLGHRDFIGPHHSNGDLIRYWVQWLATTRNRVLELPEVYLDSRLVKGLATRRSDRRESEIDDHGEAYPANWSGPDLNVTLHVPKGEYTLSMYEFNKDGHYGTDRDRDYLISAEVLPPGAGVESIMSQYGSAPFYDHSAEIVGRLVNFWGGVWYRFLVRGPMVMLIRVGRNYSFNTILAGAMLDPLNEHPAPYYYGMAAWRRRLRQLSKARLALRNRWLKIGNTPQKHAGLAASKSSLASRLLRDEEFILHENSQVWAGSNQMVCALLLRWYTAKYGRQMFRARKPTQAVVARIDYRLGLFSAWEALEGRQGIMTSRHIEKGLRWDQWSDSYRGVEFSAIRKYVKGARGPPDAAKAN
ncbi:MAG: hypothetical protein HKL96_04655 [Phycisphaerales bacterium]|nr:hypothetical protein [Phycisphaerales bacterium]